MFATHRQIQETNFPDGSMVQQIKKMIQDHFSIVSIPEGFLLLAIELGGWDLKSPFIGPLQIRESVKDNPHELLNEFEQKERRPCCYL